MGRSGFATPDRGKMVRPRKPPTLAEIFNAQRTRATSPFSVPVTDKPFPGNPGGTGSTSTAGVPGAAAQAMRQAMAPGANVPGPTMAQQFSRTNPPGAMGGASALNNYGNAVSTNASGDVWDGFARRYAPELVDWNDNFSQTVLHDYLNQSGDAGSRTRGNIALEGRMADLASSAPFLFNLLMSESGNDLDAYGNDDIINWMAENLFPNASTPGGRNASAGQLLDMLFSKGMDKDNPMYDILFPTGQDGAPVDSGQQISNVNDYMQLVASRTNPFMGNAMLSRANRLAQDYRGQQAKGNYSDDSYLEYLMEELGL